MLASRGFVPGNLATEPNSGNHLSRYRQSDTTPDRRLFSATEQLRPEIRIRCTDRFPTPAPETKAVGSQLFTGEDHIALGKTLTSPFAVSASENCPPAATLVMYRPRRASMTFGSQTRVTSPWPSFPLSPDPKDHTIRPQMESAKVWALPHATWPTPEMSFTRVGTLRHSLSTPRPVHYRSYNI